MTKAPRPNVSALRQAALVVGFLVGFLFFGFLMIASCKSDPPAAPAGDLGQKAPIYEKPALPAPVADAVAVAVNVAVNVNDAGDVAAERIDERIDDAGALPVPIADYVGLDKVEDAGSVRGRVVWQGPRPVLAPEPVTKDQKVCGAEKTAGRLLIDPQSGGVANTLVWLSDIRRGRKVDALAAASLGRVRCEFVPHFQVAARGATLELSNDDPVLHNAHAYLGVRTLFNVGFTSPGQRWKKPLPGAGLLEVKNDAGHPFMTAFVMVSEHPYYAVTDARGAFSLEGIPPGSYTLRTWHEGWRVIGTNPEGRSEYEAARTAARQVAVNKSASTDVEISLRN